MPGTDFLYQRHAAVEVRIQRQRQGAVGDGLNQLGVGHLALGKENDGLQAGNGAVGRQRRRGVAGRSARHRRDVFSIRDHLLHHRHQHRHAQVLERPGVAVAALLDPQIGHPDLVSQPLGPEQVGAALEGGHDVVVRDARTDPLALAPDAAAVRPLGAQIALVEERFPVVRGTLPQGVQVVTHLQEVATARAAVNDVLQTVVLGTAGDTLKPGAIGRAVRGWIQLRSHRASMPPLRSVPPSSA